MKKNNIKKLSIIILFILIGGYFAYKSVCLYAYSHYHYKDLEHLKIVETITINKDTDSNDNFLTYENIKIKNYFTEFEITGEENSNTSPIYTFDDKKQFFYGKELSYIEQFKTEGMYDKSINETLLEKYNITNDIDFIKLLIEHKDKKINIFTSAKKMKETYNLNYFAYLLGSGSYTLINGDYTGYIINNEQIKTVYIINKDQNYVFHFKNFDNEFIQKVISSITID